MGLEKHFVTFATPVMPKVVFLEVPLESRLPRPRVPSPGNCSHVSSRVSCLNVVFCFPSNFPLPRCVRLTFLNNTRCALNTLTGTGGISTDASVMDIYTFLKVYFYLFIEKGCNCFVILMELTNFVL